MRHVTLPMLITTTVLLACASTTVQKPRPVVFNEGEYERYRADGNSTVEGQAFMKTKAGIVKYGAGEQVYLVPVTSYSREWFEQSVIRGEALDPSDPRTARFRRTATADDEGCFRFESVPAGDYYVVCRVSWVVHHHNGAGTARKGGWAYAQVSVDDHETARAIVTR
jgi:hypothetical protein